MRLLMCKPDYFQVKWIINPWMEDNVNGVNSPLAAEQWDKFYNELKKYVHIDLIPQRPNCPDMVFTANAGLVKSDRVALSHFRSNERADEECWFERWFLDKGYIVVRQSGYPFEGAGDFLIHPQQINSNYFGHGYRSSLNAGAILNTIAPSFYWYPLKLINPHFYHLDTCFCPLDQETILCYPRAINEIDLYHATRNNKLITVTEEEANQFACNAVVIGKDVFMPNCYSVADKLDRLGFTPHLFEMSEFIKSGGACKCLTLEI